MANRFFRKFTWLWLGLACLATFVYLYNYSFGSRVQHLVNQVGADKLIQYTQDLEKRGVLDSVNGSLPKEVWLEDFTKCGVISVKPYIDGLQIVMQVRGRKVRGIYVATEKAHEPSEGSGISFVKLADGIYIYDEKTRTPYTNGVRP